MTANTDNLTPQERLARIVREETGGGRRVVRFLVKVTEGDLDHEGFKPNHRMDSAKELVKIGLTEFDDYIVANTSPTKRRASKSKQVSPNAAELSPEIEAAREELAQYARELTQDGRTVIARYAEIMDGLRNHEGFKPHHRIAAGKELLLRGFGPVSAWPEPAPADSQITAHQPNQTNHSSDHAPEPEPHPSIPLTPTVSEYLSDAVKAYEKRSPLRQLLPQNILDMVDGDDPIECPCLIDEDEGREPYCPENEECPYYGIEFPEFTEEESQRIKEHTLRGLQMRAELLGYANPSEEDP